MQIYRKIYFKELVHVILRRLTSPKPAGCVGRLETQGRAQVTVQAWRSSAGRISSCFLRFFSGRYIGWIFFFKYCFCIYWDGHWLFCYCDELRNSAGKESSCNAGDLSLIPGWGRSHGEGIGYPLQYYWASLVTQMVKNSSVMWETWVRSLGWEDPLEEGVATTPVFWPRESPWTEEPGGLQSVGSQRVRPNWVTNHEHVWWITLILFIYNARLNLLRIILIYIHENIGLSFSCNVSGSDVRVMLASWNELGSISSFIFGRDCVDLV